MEKEIKVRDLFLVLKTRFWMILLLTITATLATGYYGMTHTTALYKSSTQILIPMGKDGSMSTFGVILKDHIVLDQVVERLGLKRTSDALSEQITMGNKDGSDIVEISVVDTDPKVAAQISNTAANVFLQQISNIFGIYDSKILSKAQAAKIPLPINQAKKFGIGFAGGVVLSLGLVFLLDSLDNTVKTEQEIERLLGFPVLGSVSKMKAKNTSAKKRTRTRANKGGTINV